MSSNQPLRVHVLYEHSADQTPHGCSQIRLLRPLTHPVLQSFMRMTSGTELPEELPDLVVIERLWNQRADLIQLGTLLDKLDRQSIPVIAELDDDLLTLGEAPGIPVGPNTDQKMWLRHLLRKASGVIVSTLLLAERVKRLNPAIAVVPNALDERLFNRKSGQADQGKSVITFGYMGTYTHLADLLSIIGPLRRILEKYKTSVSFELVGIGKSELLMQLFEGLPFRIRSVPVQDVSYENFTAWMQKNLDWDFAIAPLVDTDFSRSKSDIKFLDYGAMAIPGVFSPVPAYANTVKHLSNGLLASTTEEWEAALELLITNQAVRTRLSTTVQEEVWNNRMLATCATRWWEAIQIQLNA